METKEKKTMKMKKKEKMLIILGDGKKVGTITLFVLFTFAGFSVYSNKSTHLLGILNTFCCCYEN